MASLNCVALAKYPIFQERVDFAMKKAAIAISSEADTTPNYANRQTWVRNVTQGRSSVYDFALGITTQLEVTIGTNAAAVADAAISDADIYNQTASIVNAYARG